jgi:hypothetical protein
MKLKYTELKNYRLTNLAEQGHKCYLCGEPIIDDAVLDHDHKTGLIRRVLHRGCNALLGKIENNMARNRITVQRLEKIADNLIKYMATQHTDLIHPTFKEKKMRALPTRGMRTKTNRGKKPPKKS